MNIVLTFNYHNEKKYGYVSAEFDSPKTISNIQKAIESGGHRVELIEGDENFYPKLHKLKQNNKVDLVFNYSVGIWGRSRETHVPAMCEMLQVPYASSDVLSTALCMDKARAKDLFMYYGLKAPRGYIFNHSSEKIANNINFPLIVKYIFQGSSIGLKDDQAVVYNEKDLYKRVKKLYEFAPQKIMAEEYIAGREFTVGFYGNQPEITLFPLVEIKPTPEQKKSDWVFNSKQQPVSNVVEIDQKLKNRIDQTAKKIINIFELRDWGRIDLRVRGNEVYILEINNCAHLSHTSVYWEGAQALGLSYDQLIINMLNSALKRNNLI